MAFNIFSKYPIAKNFSKFALEFILVIFGVFLGIQFSNKNDARIAIDLQSGLMQQLKVEFETIEKSLIENENEYAEILKSTGYVISTLRLKTPPTDIERLKKALRFTINFPDTPALSSTYKELISSGEFSKIPNSKLRASLHCYNDYYERQERRNSVAIAAILDPSLHYFEAVNWSVDTKDWSNPDDAIISYDWSELIEARGEMQVWLGHQYDALSNIRKMLKQAELVLQLLEKPSKNEVFKMKSCNDPSFNQF